MDFEKFMYNFVAFINLQLIRRPAFFIVGNQRQIQASAWIQVLVQQKATSVGCLGSSQTELVKSVKRSFGARETLRVLEMEIEVWFHKCQTPLRPPGALRLVLTRSPT